MDEVLEAPVEALEAAAEDDEGLGDAQSDGCPTANKTNGAMTV